MRTVQTLVLTALCAAAAPALAADLKAGQALHETHCLSCHDTGVYTREDRKVTSLEALNKQVRRCELSLELTWYDEDVENVVQYLNGNYYRFQ